MYNTFVDCGFGKTSQDSTPCYFRDTVSFNGEDANLKNYILQQYIGPDLFTEHPLKWWSMWGSSFFEILAKLVKVSIPEDKSNQITYSDQLQIHLSTLQNLSYIFCLKCWEHFWHFNMQFLKNLKIDGKTLLVCVFRYEYLRILFKNLRNILVLQCTRDIYLGGKRKIKV